MYVKQKVRDRVPLLTVGQYFGIQPTSAKTTEFLQDTRGLCWTCIGRGMREHCFRHRQTPCSQAGTQKQAREYEDTLVTKILSIAWTSAGVAKKSSSALQTMGTLACVAIL